MNKDWDKAVVSVETWKECFRVLKSGSFAFVMSAPRQDVMSHMIVNLSKAGFKTDYTPMFWAYASGFPKAMNISKAVDKKLGVFEERIGTGEIKKAGFIRKGRTDEEIWLSQKNIQSSQEVTKPSSPQAKRLDGSYAGFQPKPAVEVILVCMKPLSEKNYIDQAMKNDKGVTWLDDCRIPTDDVIEPAVSAGSNGLGEAIKGHEYTPNNQGRFPANLLVSDNALDIGKKTKSVNSARGGYRSGYDLKSSDDFNNYECGFDDSGDFSRYFSLDQWEAQFIITPKPSKSEKNKGLDKYLSNQDQYGGKFLTAWKLSPSKVNDGRKTEIDNPFQRGETVRQNIHPTVKPISLFRYLITLGSRPKDFILDPFMGSGTTAISCETLARNWIGIELNPQYCEIIKARISDYEKQEKLF